MVAPGTNDNLIEDNTILGNTNGIVLNPGVEGNVVRDNIVMGNPPVQLSVTFPGAGGEDIRNAATPGANTIVDNVCLTAKNASCPAISDQDKRKDHDGPTKDDGQTKKDR